MGQILGFLVLVAVAVVALKLAIALAFLTAIIWRPKETISLILVLGALALFRNYPVPSMIVIGIVIVASIVGAARKRTAGRSIKLPDEPDS